MKTILTVAFLLLNSIALLAQTASISGKVTSVEGEFLGGVTIQLLDEDGAVVATTNNASTYRFDDLPTGETYSLKISKIGSPLNGLSTYDIVLMHRHILGTAILPEPYQILAGDVNGSNTLSIADIVEMKLLILAVRQDFRTGRNWGFIPADYQFETPSNPFPEVGDISNTFILNDDLSEQNYIAFKYGDLNGTFVPE
ncbi:MAG: hypothetical protein KTR30_03365 [Saprospiraceae bacterium]|nr:hypothetical protein [Saprospiraceae bacterium]